ncbi:hypothetical protein [Actinophytocola oryzae]|uniref:Lipoprotein n=1 Tax=Actinophytocola oryzae TaxID=502181 RepID=A0A4R7VAS4_9PSEU|nr:hypothetical protein [Actinophytocola oryzae]TDV46068.1 hypothetical protein CLV71_11126 [Actinophytocola oryzae]
MSPRLSGLAAALCALVVVAGCGVPAQTAPVATTQSTPPPKPTKPYTVEQLAATVGCTPEFQGRTADFRQAACKVDKTNYMMLDFVTDKNQKDWYDNAIIYGNSYLVGERWILTTSSDDALVKLQDELGGSIEQDKSMGSHGMAPMH